MPEESCNGADDDCDGDVDEGTLNACGACGDVPAEVCNGQDDDCDDSTDEGVTNACGRCGEVPDEACDGTDEDCDGLVDEGLLNGCGACGPVPVEVCNNADEDCDGLVDEGLRNLCGECGAAPEEVCNRRDDDCDGEVDEGVRNACGGCGDVPAEVCNDFDDDCDGATDEELPQNLCDSGCHVLQEQCNNHDDDCDGTTDEGLPHNACRYCGPVPVEVCNDVDDDCDEVVDEDLALNRCGVCGPLPEEVCDGVDQDCDGRVDDGFDVGRSIEHCGGCGVACSEANATPVCVAGRCVVVQCDDGFRDADLDPDNGCEAPVPEGRVWYVDAGAEGGDGLSLQAPFGRFSELVELQDGDRVLVGPGAYEARFDFAVPGVRYEARERHEAVLTGPPGEGGAVVTVSGARVALDGFRVVGSDASDVGVLVTGDAVTVSHNVVTSVHPAALTAAGIRVDGADGVVVRGNHVDDVQGGVFTPAACLGSAPSAFGVQLSEAADALLKDNLVTGLVGGTSGECAPEGNAGAPGGLAAAYRLDGTQRARLLNNAARDVNGGAGSAVPARNSGRGGAAVGVSVGNSTDLLVDGAGQDLDGEPTAIADLRAGVAGPPGVYVGYAGTATGLSFGRVDGVVVTRIHVDGVTGGVGGTTFLWAGRPVPVGAAGGAARGMFLGTVTGGRFSENRFEGIRGGAGARGAPSGSAVGVDVNAASSDLEVDASNTVEGQPGYVGVGLRGVLVEGIRQAEVTSFSNWGQVVVLDSRDVTVRDCVVRGGAGAPGDPDQVHGLLSSRPDGGAGVGVRIERCTGGVRVHEVEVSDVAGGAAGQLGDGGDGTGLRLRDNEGVDVRGVTVERVTGGAAADQAPGDAVGVDLSGSPAGVSGLLVARVAGGSAAGVTVSADRPALLRRSTVYGVTDGVGLRVTGDGAPGAASVRHFIFAVVGGPAIVSAAGPAAVLVDYSNFDRVQVSVEYTDEGHNLAVPSGFADEILGDFALAPDSACVDAGDPDVPCGDEPEGEGGACRLDLGHLAGTGDAQAR